VSLSLLSWCNLQALAGRRTTEGIKKTTRKALVVFLFLDVILCQVSLFRTGYLDMRHSLSVFLKETIKDEI
jgi:hypothetical protein